MNISDHARERYALRVAGKDRLDVKSWAAQNADKIDDDINKLISHGKCVYQGKRSKDKKPCNVYIKGTIVLLVSADDSTVITLYKIDLGLDDEFNKMYMKKMLEKLNSQKQEYEKACGARKAENEGYEIACKDMQDEINECKTTIASLQSLIDSYQSVIKNNEVKVNIARNKVEKTINDLVNKKEF